MADKQTILNNLLVSLERLSDHYSKLELNGLNPADRQTVLNDIGTIQTKLEQILGTSDSITSSELKALRDEYQALVDSVGNLTNQTYDDILTTEQKNHIDNFSSIKSSVSEIDNLCFLGNTYLIDVQKFFIKSFNSDTPYSYLCTGDSTSSASYMYLQELYSSVLSCLNCTYYDNSYPGQTSIDWLNNIDNNTINLAIANSFGDDGENTIMEFSLGINDFDGVNTRDDIFNLLKTCILTYKASKPKALIFLSSTIRTSSTSRDSLLLDVYNQLEIELGLYHFKRYSATQKLWDNPLFYYDYLHPNRFGARAWFYDLFNNIVPLVLKKYITIEQFYDVNIRDTSFIKPCNFKRGYYQITTSLGVYKSDVWALCVDKIPVVEGEQLLISHRGERKEYFYYDSLGNYISKSTLSGANNNTYSLTIPVGVSFVSFNISLKYKTYHPSKDIFTIHKPTDDKNIWLHSDYFLQTIKNSFAVSDKYNGFLLDGYGNIPALGQILKLDSNYRLKWE
jgi:hypothetical protein